MPLPAPSTVEIELLVDEAPVLPSMDLPAGHMAQRPAAPRPAYVGTVLSKASQYRRHDVVRVTDARSPHFGRLGTVDCVFGTVKPVVVEIDNKIVYLDEDDVEFVRRPSDADTERFPAVEVPITLVLHRPDVWTVQDDTLKLDAVPVEQPLQIGDVVRVDAFGELYDECTGRIVKFSPQRRDGLTVRIEILTAIPTLQMLVGREVSFAPSNLKRVDDVVLMGGAAR
jgi:hypothetical protein